MHWTKGLTWSDEGEALLDEIAETASTCADCTAAEYDLAGDASQTVQELCTEHYREFYARYADIRGDDDATTTDDWAAVEARVESALADVGVDPAAVEVRPGEPLDRSVVVDAAADLVDAVEAISELAACVPVAVSTDRADVDADVAGAVADLADDLDDSVKAVHDAVPLARAFPAAAAPLADPLAAVLTGDAKPQYRLFAGAALGHVGRADPDLVDAHADAIRQLRYEGDTARQTAWLRGAVAAVGALAQNPLTGLDAVTTDLRRLADPERFDGASFSTGSVHVGVEALGYLGDDDDLDHLRWLGDLATTHDSTTVRARTAIDRIEDYPLGHWGEY